MTKILICKIGALGDVFFAMPSVGAIKSRFPDCEITWLVGRACESVLRGHPQIDKIVAIDEAVFSSGSPLQRIKAVVDLRRKLSGRYDAILLAHRNIAYAASLFGLGPIYQIVRKANPKLKRWVRQVLVAPLKLHESYAIRDLTQAALQGLAGEEPIPQIEWRWNLDYLTASGDPVEGVDLPNDYLCLHVGGGSNAGNEFALKQWPHWGLFLRRMLKQWPGSCVLVGSRGDAATAERIVGDLSQEEKARALNLAGQTDLRQLVRAISNAKLFLGCDSGPLHIADALGIPSIGIYGPTSEISWGLLGERSRALRNPTACSPCYKDDGIFPACPFHRECMVGLTPKIVLEAVKALSSVVQTH